MPSKNKPKRLDRNRSWRVARRKREKKARAEGTSRNRQPSPKTKKVAVEKKVIKVEKAVEKKVVKKINKE